MCVVRAADRPWSCTGVSIPIFSGNLERGERRLGHSEPVDPERVKAVLRPWASEPVRFGLPGPSSMMRMEKLVESLGVTRLSKSQVSIMAAELDAQVEAFRTAPSIKGHTRSSPPTLSC